MPASRACPVKFPSVYFVLMHTPHLTSFTVNRYPEKMADGKIKPLYFFDSSQGVQGILRSCFGCRKPPSHHPCAAMT